MGLERIPVQRPIREKTPRVASPKRQDQVIQRMKLVTGAIRVTSDLKKRNALVDELLVLARVLSDPKVNEGAE